EQRIMAKSYMTGLTFARNSATPPPAREQPSVPLVPLLPSVPSPAPVRVGSRITCFLPFAFKGKAAFAQNERRKLPKLTESECKQEIPNGRLRSPTAGYGRQK